MEIVGVVMEMYLNFGIFFESLVVIFVVVLFVVFFVGIYLVWCVGYVELIEII